MSVIVVFIGLLGLIAVFVIGLLVGRMTKRKSSAGPSLPRAVENQPVPFHGDRVDIKHCAQCESTYTDEELNYCLRDGTQLRVVGSMPRPADPEATKVINPRRTS